jgi:opacity protein-like surface antigen
MNNRLISTICVSVLAVASSGACLANGTAVKSLPPEVGNWSGLYIGVGGSYNWAHFDQSLQGVSGTINVLNGATPVAQGQEGGPFFDFDRNESGFAPDAQIGYMVPFAGGDWLAGFKFTYKYANMDSKENVSIPQDGTGTILSGPRAGTSEPITGFVQISPAEIHLKHQFELIATIGRAFGNVLLYAGGGPALFDVETNFINGIPFATSGLGTVAVSVPISASNNNWVWGGAVQVGAAYAFARNWFLDFSYTYAVSENFTIEDPVFVHNQVGSLTFSGPAVLNAQEQVVDQSVELTLNYRFR